MENLRNTLDETGVSPSSLTFDIAEEVLMQNVDESTTLVSDLRELGAEVFMDDFGTEHSPLITPPLLPLQGVKLDRPLVHRMGTRRTDLEVVRSMVDMAKSVGLSVVAEGVETVAQRERLIAFGCELGQGHLFTEPLGGDSTRDPFARSGRLGPRSA